MRQPVTVLSFIGMFTLLTTIGFGENRGAGILKGTVVGKDRQPLPFAHVIIPNIERGASTNERGEFSIVDLPEGSFQAVARMMGYKPETKIITIAIDRMTIIEFTLEPTVFESEAVVVTGNPYASNPLTTPQDVSVLGGREKSRFDASSLGKTIESLPGVYNLSAGGESGKPVIRGHTGERVLILSDGIAQEYQQYGERHAPTVEPYNFERIEVIRGASSLLYGSDGLGGAVNVIPKHFHFSGDEGLKVNGSLDGSYSSNSNERSYALKIEATEENLGFHGSLIRRLSDNFHTSDVDGYPTTRTKDDPKFTREIPFTDFESISGFAGAGYLSPIGLVALNYDYYRAENNFLLPNIPNPALGAPIGIRRMNHVASLQGNFPLGHVILKPKLSFQNNVRLATREVLSRSFLDDSAVVNLNLNVFTGRFDVEHVDLFALHGTTGAEVRYYNHRNYGKIPLQPDGHYANLAFYTFEEWKHKQLTVNFGVRWDHRTQTFYGSPSNPLLNQDDFSRYSSFSGGIGASYQLLSNLTVTANLSRGFRIPSFFNLYVYGLHGGVFAFQIGNPNLKNEHSLDVSTSIRYRDEKVEASITLYQNRIENYIFLYDAKAHPLAPVNSQFVFAHDQADALLRGLDVNYSVNPVSFILLSGGYSLIRSEFVRGAHSGKELPLMPADRATLEVKVLLPDFSALKNIYTFFGGKHVAAKSAAGAYEPFGQFDDGFGPTIPFGVCSTDKYILFNVGLGFELAVASRPVQFNLEIANLFDASYRDFLDTYKGYTLAPGRSANLKASVPFGVE